MKKYCTYIKKKGYPIKKIGTITCNNTRWILHMHSCESLDNTNRQAEFASLHAVLRSCTSKESWLILLSNGGRVIGRMYSFNLRPDDSSRRASLSSGISMTSMIRDDRLTLLSRRSNIWHFDSFLRRQILTLPIPVERDT